VAKTELPIIRILSNGIVFPDGLVAPTIGITLLHILSEVGFVRHPEFTKNQQFGSIDSTWKPIRVFFSPEYLEAIGITVEKFKKRFENDEMLGKRL
jgi:hypothetical protein